VRATSRRDHFRNETGIGEKKQRLNGMEMTGGGVEHCSTLKERLVCERERSGLCAFSGFEGFGALKLSG